MPPANGKLGCIQWAIDYKTRHPIFSLHKTMSHKRRVYQLIEAVPAHWVWKDDTKTLELVSLQPTADAKDKRVRSVLDPLNQVFERTRHMNKFLKTLLNYFSAFLSKYELETKPGTFVTALEQIEMAEADAKMELCQKLMAQIYSKLLLGLDMAKQHHMACGKAMGSATHKDRKLYEVSDTLGIIGEPLSNFFSEMLIPIESYIESEDRKEHDDEALPQKSRHSYAADSSLGDISSSHHNRDISRATTLGVESEYDF
ncbi:uncharacterized protein LOC119962493 [Scyliorhinus canicula]|uniref:uncharacterized protein LOC119962493 n=1 Tax=Scyliorhinus canicula TaxID=7830 RepID=UPI0018F566FE|nr:uncharacterized protein LOC119962493 [Scyliorhinus canicula]